MKEYKYHYTYLITNLNPVSDLKYYVGVRSCDCKPVNDAYMGTSAPLKKDIINGSIENFEKIIIEEFATRAEADLHENQLHLDHTAAINPLFYNKKNGIIGFHVTDEATRKHKEKKADLKWKATTGATKINKFKETVNDLQYKNTKGLAAVNKRKKIFNDPGWLSTIGKNKGKKISIIRNDPEWIKTNTFTCDHCGLTMTGKGNYNRWHGDNCKSK